MVSVSDKVRLRCLWVIQVKRHSKHRLIDCSTTRPGLNEDRNFRMFSLREHLIQWRGINLHRKTGQWEESRGLRGMVGCPRLLIPGPKNTLKGKRLFT